MNIPTGSENKIYISFRYLCTDGMGRSIWSNWSHANRVMYIYVKDNVVSEQWVSGSYKSVIGRIYTGTCVYAGGGNNIRNLISDKTNIIYVQTDRYDAGITQYLNGHYTIYYTFDGNYGTIPGGITCDFYGGHTFCWSKEDLTCGVVYYYDKGNEDQPNSIVYKVERWYHIRQIVCGEGFVVGLKSDGTCLAACDTDRYNWGIDVSSWIGIRQITSSRRNVFGLKSDGTVVGSGKPDYNILQTVRSWSNIKKIIGGGYHVLGLGSNGYITFAGRNAGYGEANVHLLGGNNVDVAAGSYFSIGIKADGNVNFIGRNQDNTAYSGVWKLWLN
jgi:hypothetical protein